MNEQRSPTELLAAMLAQLERQSKTLDAQYNKIRVINLILTVFFFLVLASFALAFCSAFF